MCVCVRVHVFMVSMILSCHQGSLVWTSPVWPTTTALYLWWSRNSSTISRCTASTQKASTGNLAPPIKSRNWNRVWTQVRYLNKRTNLSHQSFLINNLVWFICSLLSYRCEQYKLGRLQHPCHRQRFQAVAARFAQSPYDLWTVWGIPKSHGWVISRA